MADIEKLDRALEYIEQHPEEWDQSDWGYRKATCGTAGCLAFHVGAIDRAEIVWDEADLLLRDASDPVHMFCDTISGKHPWDYARDALGLTEGQADALFSGSNTLDDLKAMRALLATNPAIEGRDLEAATTWRNWHAEAF